jgi:hypothetical protein
VHTRVWPRAPPTRAQKLSAMAAEVKEELSGVAHVAAEKMGIAKTVEDTPGGGGGGVDKQ